MHLIYLHTIYTLHDCLVLYGANNYKLWKYEKLKVLYTINLYLGTYVLLLLLNYKPIDTNSQNSQRKERKKKKCIKRNTERSCSLIYTKLEFSLPNKSAIISERLKNTP